MPAKFFTVAEANALLPHIRPLMGALLARRNKAIVLSQRLDGLWEENRADKGSLAASTLAQEFATIEALITKIEAYGCVIKDLNGGLLDFLAELDGREVYLCWRYNEDQIAYYHELHTGFNGRKPVK